jgi:predicted transcriptional regulator
LHGRGYVSPSSSFCKKDTKNSQKKLEELSGVSQPVIARMERGNNPQLDTVLKVLAPLGKTLSAGILNGNIVVYLTSCL